MVCPEPHFTSIVYSGLSWQWITVIVVLFVAFVLPFLISIIFIPPLIFDVVHKRNKPTKWSREIPSSRNPGILEMWQESLRFRETHKDKESEIEATTADGYHLKGLYHDFGGDTAVVILGGRPETCIYALFYAYPYAEKGVNVCTFDPRGHGLSDGVYSGCGYAEVEDYLAFIKELIAKGNKRIIIHGICVGSCAAAFLGAREDLPPELKGIIFDGVFIHYYETLKRRIKKNKGLLYPTLWIFRHRIKKLYGFDCLKVGPITELPKLKLPCLMMASKEDIFSLPKNTELLYEVNGSPNKKLEWFEHGPHSHLRRVDTKHYDTCVKEFIDLIQK